MTRYVIGPDVAVRLAGDRTVIADGHRLVAPTLTQIRADAFVTLDADLARAVTGLVPVAPIEALSAQVAG